VGGAKTTRQASVWTDTRFMRMRHAVIIVTPSFWPYEYGISQALRTLGRKGRAWRIIRNNVLLSWAHP
jgi:hypothetical protein